MAYIDDGPAFFAPLTREGATQVLTLKKIAGVNVTPVYVKPGYYSARCPAGTSDKTITLLAKEGASPVVADTALTLPAADTAETAGLMSAPGDMTFAICVDKSYPYLACAWDGGADSTLILTRTYKR